MKIRDEWVATEDERNNHFTVDLEINDYPALARSKVSQRVSISNI
jgi:hypothetical protein